MPVNPIVKQTAQAMVLSAFSNFLAQTLTAYQESKPLSIQTYSLRPILDFVFFAILNVPVNVLWQEWLEATFPGTNKPSEASRSRSDSASHLTEKERAAMGKTYAHLKELEKDHPAPHSQHTDPTQTTGEGGSKMTGDSESGLNVRNTLTKLALDQTIGAAGNTILFYVGMGAIKGQGWSEIQNTMQNDAIGLWMDGLKVWLPVSVISFTVLPVEQRVLFGSLVGVAWGVYLSLVAA